MSGNMSEREVVETIQTLREYWSRMRYPDAVRREEAAIGAWEWYDKTLRHCVENNIRPPIEPIYIRPPMYIASTLKGDAQ